MSPCFPASIPPSAVALDANEEDPQARPPGWRNPKATAAYHLLIIGAGPGGIVAARAAVALGARVALIEQGQIGGGCLNHGCIPSKTIIRTSRLYAEMRDAQYFGGVPPADLPVDFAAIAARMRLIQSRIARKASANGLVSEGIALYFGSARFVGPDSVEVDGQRLRFRKALIATGSRPLLPRIPGLAEAGYLTSETVFKIDKLPPSLLVIGGGPLGCELAQTFARLGTRTVIAHSEPLFLPLEERDAAQMVSEALARDGVEIHLNSSVVTVRLQDGRKVVELTNDGNVATTAVDQILTGIGRVPAVSGLALESAGVAFDEDAGVQVDDFLRTTNPRIYAAGDVCLEHKFTNTAEASARVAVGNALLFGRGRMSALTIPWCTYTDPEIAHVGLYVRQARERGIPVKTFTIPMNEIDRAITDGEEKGFVKIHVVEGSDRILGATIVARHAGDAINSISLAMVAGVGLHTLAGVLHAYPTQGSAVRKAADAYMHTRSSPMLAWAIRRWLLR
jgi:pyruvate/2-oxoglutarate dehydrogenase complex dihydrolipoamide dehydrogenase (E3) component